MVLNDSFSALFASPASLKKANDSFNESFGDKNTLSPATILRILHKEHEQISSILRVYPPTTSQYQTSLNELISLFERAEDQSTIGFQRLVIAVFLKLAANILNALGKPKYQPTLYKLSQLIASSIIPDLESENQVEEKNMQNWADRLIIESSIHLLEFPNYQIDVNFSIENIVDDLVLANGRFQFVKSSIFEAARDIVTEMDTSIPVDLNSKFTLENLGEEPFLRLLLWYFLRQKAILTGDFLPSLFSLLPQSPNAQEYIKSSECSLLDLKLYLVSLSVVASTTTESGITARSPPVVASQLALTKHQKDCWKAIVDAAAGSCSKAIAALARLRTSQLVESVRLISDGSEDVRVLFEAWKHCLRPSAAYDDDVIEAIDMVTEKYRSKMNSLLAYGPCYSSDPCSFSKASSTSRREMKTMFPLQFDYEFVNTTEAEHIGTVINSLEGYISPEPEEQKEEEEAIAVTDYDSFGDETFHSFGTSSDRLSSADNSQFFSPLKHNRQSMAPSAISQLIREESLANTSIVSTKSVIMTPTTRPSAGTPAKSERDSMELSFERLQEVVITAPSKGSEEAEDEEDELEAALLESTQKHEKSLLAQKSPEKMLQTPKKDAQTETEDGVLSSGESVVTVRYTPKKDKEWRKIEYSDEEEEEYEEEEEEEEDYEDETEVDISDEEEDLLDESELEELKELIREATFAKFRDRRMEKFGISAQKIKTENRSEEEILQDAEEKLAKIKGNLSITFKRLEAVRLPSYTPVIPHLMEQTDSTRATIGSDEEEGVDHDWKKCLGCQDVSE